MGPSHNYVMEGSITTWYFRVFLVGSRSYSVIIGGSDTINGVSGRFRYVLPYLRVFLEGSRSYNVITGGSNPRDSGIIEEHRRHVGLLQTRAAASDTSLCTTKGIVDSARFVRPQAVIRDGSHERPREQRKVVQLRIVARKGEDRVVHITLCGPLAIV